MALHDIKKIGVVGAGTMGRGIAQLFALHDYPVVLADRDEAVLEGALERVMERTEPELHRSCQRQKKPGAEPPAWSLDI